METAIYNQSGKEVSKISLPDEIFGLPWNESLVHQVVVGMMANKRIPVAHAKNRGEVSGTGKKPWKQKGTGRARHGSRRSPIWVGGGVSHGPRNEKNYGRKINKKMKSRALFTLLSRKFKDGEVFFLEEISLKAPKTKEAKNIIDSLAKVKGFESLKKRKNAAFIALAKKDQNVSKSFNNFGNIEISEMKDLNALDLLSYKYLIFSNAEKSLEYLSSKIK